MTETVIILPVITTLDTPFERVAAGAVEELDKGLIIGWDKDGHFYFASSISIGPE